MDDYPSHCGRVIQSSGPARYAIVDGMNVRDSRLQNYPPRWNAAPSQEPLPPRSFDQRICHTSITARPLGIALPSDRRGR
jgi:hypothetical protein